MTFSRRRAAVKTFAFMGLVGGLLLPYLVLLALAPTQRHRVARLFFKGCLTLVGIRLNVHGRVGDEVVLFAANHASYLDIPVLGALIADPAFVAKSEVAEWPLFGFLARVARTQFISRTAKDARQQCRQLGARINQGDRLVVFPEGTSTDGSCVRTFKSSLFACLDDVRGPAWVQTVTIAYARDRAGQPLSQNVRNRFTWFGDMTLAPHLWAAFGGEGCDVDVVFAEPIARANFPDRKQLAKYCEGLVGDTLQFSLGGYVEPVLDAAE